MATEFTLMDRPIVFLDTPKLFKRVKKRAPAFDPDTYGRKIGTVVREGDDPAAAVAAALANPDREAKRRRQMAEHVFHAPGRAARVVADVIQYAAGLSDELPAGAASILADEQEEPSAHGN